MTRLRALGLYGAATVPLGILAHLTAETAALHRGIVDLACRPLHAYLAVLAIGSLCAVLGGLRGSDLRRRGALLAQALPFRGKGAAFVALSAALQMGFVAVTVLAEGDPLAAGSTLSALMAALAAALVGALALQLVRSRIAEAAPASTRVTHVALRYASRRAARCFSGPYFAFVAVRGNRPPPFAFPFA